MVRRRPPWVGSGGIRFTCGLSSGRLALLVADAVWSGWERTSRLAVSGRVNEVAAGGGVGGCCRCDATVRAARPARRRRRSARRPPRYGLQCAFTGLNGGAELPSSSVSLLETADVARDGPRRDTEGLGDLLEAEALVAELEDARDGADRERRAKEAAPAGYPARASERCPVRRQRRRARVGNVRSELAEVVPVEARPLRPRRA